ncbi:hypothetical protein [Actinoallomurus sp. CA-150999]|uniref:hypothetical protein n=1 Tax=Actinoallomurus sp. CA-150999 TaxID=3239887 RepID=UPI003D92860B
MTAFVERPDFQDANEEGGLDDRRLITLIGAVAARCPEEIPGFFEPPGPDADRRLLDGFRTLLGENRPIVVGTRSPEEEGSDQLLAAGLLEGHYYDVVLVDDEGFIHLHNPWNRLHPPPLTAQGFRSAFSGFSITWLGS